VPARASQTSYVELDDEFVVAVERPDAQRFDAHWLDRTAAVVWSSFDGTTPLRQLIDDLAVAFGADRQVVRDDVLQLTRTLGRAGLLEGVAFEAPVLPAPTRPEGMPIGTSVPPFALEDLDGNAVTPATVFGNMQVLVNWSPTCGYCVRIAPDLARLTGALRGSDIELVLVTSGSVADNRRVLDDAGLDCTVWRGDSFDLFDGLGTPTAYLVDEQGAIASELQLGANELPAFLEQLVAGG
jgi:thiol-disulfide isomerase/thioredoxin